MEQLFQTYAFRYERPGSFLLPFPRTAVLFTFNSYDRCRNCDNVGLTVNAVPHFSKTGEWDELVRRKVSSHAITSVDFECVAMDSVSDESSPSH